MPKVLPKTVRAFLNKALDSALLAVETYNKPAAKFKSGGYIVLMCIAWTALFHSIFYKKHIKPIYKVGRYYKKVDEDYQYWELKTCVSKYFLNSNDPIKANLEFFIPLRNKLEHKFLPEIDSTIFAECQALLLNFDRIVEREYGTKYCLRESLSFALQLFPSSETLSMAIRDNKTAKGVYEWIEHYRSSITTEILESGEYSFKAFLIQVANHDSKDAMPIQFYSYADLSEEEKKNIKQVAALVKPKHIMQPVSNYKMMKPGEVVNLVQIGLGNKQLIRGKRTINKFNQDTHTRCWKKYHVRPLNGDPHPEITETKYCVYDSMNKNYGYSMAWVEFLIEKLSDPNEYNSLFN